jgi:hypothetical protein
MLGRFVSLANKKDDLQRNKLVTMIRICVFPSNNYIVPLDNGLYIFVCLTIVIGTSLNALCRRQRFKKTMSNLYVITIREDGRLCGYLGFVSSTNNKIHYVVTDNFQNASVWKSREKAALIVRQTNVEGARVENVRECTSRD